jgi:Flp pilus assembly protein TadG
MARKQRQGSAAVEFAVLLPFLAMIMMGMMEYGRAIQLKETLTDCAREACRNAILPGQTDSQVQAEVVDILTRQFNATVAANNTTTIKVNDVTSTSSLGSSVRGDKISVQVQVQYSQVSWVTGYLYRGQNIESETVVMMRQGP